MGLFNKNKSKKNRSIFDVPAVLSDFYALAHKLSNLRDVKFKELKDEVDELHWKFNYQGKKYMLQFSIYNGMSLIALEDIKKEDAAGLQNEVAQLQGV